MRLVFIAIIFSALSLSCGVKDPKSLSKDNNPANKNDSSASTADDKPVRVQFITRRDLELPGYSIQFVSKYYLPAGSVSKKDSGQYFENNYLIASGKKTNTHDTLKVEGDGDISDCPACNHILKDLTDSLKFPYPIVQLVTPQLDIYYSNLFFGCKNGSWKQLFEIADTTETGVRLKRKDNESLVTYITARDEAVDYYENDYPVIINVNTFKIQNVVPDTQRIGFNTAATQSFNAHMIINGHVEDELMNVEVGESVIVDTIFRKLKKVHIRVADSVQLEIKVETAKKKLRPLQVG